MASIIQESIENLMNNLDTCSCLHIECNQEIMEELFLYIKEYMRGRNAAYITLQEKGYERDTVRHYLRFFHELFGETRDLDTVMDAFGLLPLSRRRMRDLKPGECMKTQLARISMQQAEFCFLEEPLLNLDEDGTRRVLHWMEEQCGNGVRFITAHSSLRHTLLMPGTAFYYENGAFHQAEHEEEDSESLEEGTFEVLKIPAKSGSRVLLFDPKDIDYVESSNKNNYISVRGELFLVQRTMDQLEENLKKSGFFRCHRSYLVNLQKVERFEKWTKNSYVLVLNNQDNSQIPLSKGRLAELKETFQW